MRLSIRQKYSDKYWINTLRNIHFKNKKKQEFHFFTLRSEDQRNGAVAVGSVNSVTALAAWRPAPVIGPSAAAVLEAAVVAAAAAPPVITWSRISHAWSPLKESSNQPYHT